MLILVAIEGILAIITQYDKSLSGLYLFSFLIIPAIQFVALIIFAIIRFATKRPEAGKVYLIVAAIYFVVAPPTTCFAELFLISIFPHTLY
jgi:hypothetical protein